MTQRPRAHQVEDESRLEFGRALPGNWVFRNKSHDYGIDGEVEIFDENGIATGQIFYVQLRGTDEIDLRKALKLRLKSATYRYYASLKIPVLIVRYWSPKKKLFARWAHSKLKNKPKPTQKEFIFYLEEGDNLNHGLQLLEGDLRQFFHLREHDLNLPIHIQLEISKELSNLGFSKANVLLENERFNQKIGNNLIRLSEEVNDKQLGKVICNKGNTTIFLGGGSCSTKFEDLVHFKKNLNEFVADIALYVGILIDHFGKSTVANKIFVKIFPYCPSLKGKGISLAHVLNCLTEASLFEEASEMIRQCITDESFFNIHIAAAILRKKRYTNAAFPEFLLNLNRIIQDFLQKNSVDNETLGVTYSNEANLLRSFNRQKEAIASFNKARKFEPEYENKAYFWKELAGSLFGEKRYAISSKCYKKAIEIEQTKTDVWALYADASMLSGNYSEAEKWFKKYIEEEKDLEPLWQLKYHCLDSIVEGKISFQSRKKSKALKAAKEAKIGDFQSINGALSLDLLCSHAWITLGDSLHKEEKHEGSMSCYLWAAITDDKNVIAWGNAFFLTFPLKKYGLTELIFNAAYEKNGPAFLTQLYAVLDDRTSSDHTEEMKLRLLKLKENCDKKSESPSPVEIRFLGPDSPPPIMI